MLRPGRDLDVAATELGIELRAVWARAQTDTRLAIAPAGRDPDVLEERGRTLRADYLRLLAVGVGLSSGRAELILGIRGAGAWRGDDPTFAAACDAVSAASPLGRASRVIRLTPQRVARFLEELSKPGTTVVAAAAIGVSSTAIYQRRGRDEAFAKAMDDARASARQAAADLA
ncbi:hypothetical protein SAMN05216532_8059 [Streptomyces sp. 2231.1]|uniref:hypothetical protein n=1 Tax=Streptomyces sp. 2231.1 TaxID=1855347 RepID=UPI00089B0DB9|nr:hypothetical protein [Streptomyces sp. 2231.1]SEE39226.1 hypothetical protein SAMN05216532_8059 [Streptomyces sp. 2231.1]